MKKVHFLITHNPHVKWNPAVIYKLGLGGQYVKVANLAKELALLDYDVTVWGHILKPDIYNKVKYRTLTELIQSPGLGQCDHFVSLESGIPQQWFKASTSYTVWIHRNNISGIVPDSVPTGTKLVVASEFHANYLGLKKYTVVPYGVDLKLFKPDKTLPNKYGSIAFCGHPIKGMTYLPELNKKIKERGGMPNIHVYGSAELWGWAQEQFVPMQQSLLKNRIHYHGRVGQKDLARFIAQHNILFHPTAFQEPYGLAVQEAMACGLVPIVSSAGNLPELVGDAGIVIPGLPADFGWGSTAAQAIADLQSDRDRMKELSAKAIARATKVTWEDVALQWVQLVLI